MTIPVGKNIKRLRAEQKVTQDQLAEYVGISYQAISKWENNITTPDISLLPMIAEYFSITIDELFKPSMKAYVNKEQRLLSIYTGAHREDDFNRGNEAYIRLIESGKYTHEDLMGYAILLEHRSRDFVNKAIEFYDKAVTIGESIKDTTYYQAQRQRIALLMRNNRNEENIKHHESLLQKEPDVIEHYVSLALCYQFAKQYEQAWIVIERGFKLNQENALLLNMAGEICKNLNLYEDAIRYWNNSYMIDPEMSDNLFSKAFLYEKLGEKEKAKMIWEEIIIWLQERELYIETEFPREKLNNLR